MISRKQTLDRRRPISLAVCLILFSLLFWWNSSEASRNLTQTDSALSPIRLNLQLQKQWEKRVALQRGETFELTVSLPRPSALPLHCRLAVRWTLIDEKKETGSTTSLPSLLPRAPDAFGIYTKPSADWSKTLHALDPDIYLVYRAPVAGLYALEIVPVTDEATGFTGPRWREDGIAPQAVTFPSRTPWPAGKSVPLLVVVNPLELKDAQQARMQVEMEPNDTPEQAQEILLPEGEGIQAMRITGGADDIEYFDNGKVGKSGDDWFRLAFTGKEPRLLTCNLMIPDHTLAAQLRFYALDGSGALVEYTEGRNDNERAHQQNEQHRASINRVLKPGRVYFLRAEANAPGYEIELRVLETCSL